MKLMFEFCRLFPYLLIPTCENSIFLFSHLQSTYNTVKVFCSTSLFFFLFHLYFTLYSVTICDFQLNENKWNPRELISLIASINFSFISLKISPNSFSTSDAYPSNDFCFSFLVSPHPIVYTWVITIINNGAREKLCHLSNCEIRNKFIYGLLPITRLYQD